MSEETERRKFVKKMAYLAPTILTISATPSLAQSGSGNISSRSVHGNRPSNASHNGGGRGRRGGSNNGRHR